MRAVRLLVAATFGVAIVPLAAGAANAAPPSNDEVGGAVVLHLGDHDTQDTTQATTNQGDSDLNASCGAPFTNASVWYQYTPSVTRNIAVDMSASDYGVGAIIFDGTPTPDDLIACGPELVGAPVTAGHTYYIMVFSDNEVNGGNLDLRLEKAPEPRVHVSASKHGLAFHRGAAQLHGSYRCRHDEFGSVVDARLRQRAGRLKIQGEGGTGIHCDGARHRWTAKVVSPTGYYAQGPGLAKVTIIACGLVDCRIARVKRHVHLAWAPSSQRQGITRPTVAPQRPRPQYRPDVHTNLWQRSVASR